MTGLLGYHELQKGGVLEAHREAGHQDPGRGQGQDRAGRQAADEGGHEGVAASRRHSAGHDRHPLAVAGHGPEVPYRDVVRGPPRRRGLPRHEELRLQRRADDVHLQDGAHLGQGALLRLWACVLGHDRYRPEVPHYGPELRARQEGGLVYQGYSAYHSDDGYVDTWLV